MLHLPSFKSIHKGSHGRITIIGGSEHYTGAPFFSGMSALRTGCDLVSVLTHNKALIPIKCYSPDLMVSDYSDVEHFRRIVDKSHSIVIGPGLSRNPNCSIIIDQIKVRDEIPVIIDADGLFFYKAGMFKNVILTPNANEFRQLNPDNLPEIKLAEQLNATILLKGDSDKIITSTGVSVVDIKTTPRRCGGQGDVLTGILATLAAWNPSNLPLAAIHASRLLRTSAHLCFENSDGRSMISSEIPSYIGKAFDQLYPNDQERRQELELSKF